MLHFKYVLVVMLMTDGKTAPEPVATFKTQQMCEAVAFIANEGFKKQGGPNKAVCVYAMKFGEI